MTQDRLPPLTALRAFEAAARHMSFALAADELKKLFALAKTDEEKRDTLFIAAELYDRAGNWDKAIINYRSYANSYGEPADVYMEAANRLAELYEKTDVPIKRRFWLGARCQVMG